MSSKPDALVNQDPQYLINNAKRRDRMSVWFYWLCVAIAILSVVILVVLLVSIWSQGQSRLTSDLLTRAHSELEIERSGMWPAIIGSLCVCGVCAAVALPLGVGTAVFLEEFGPTNKILRWLHGLCS